MVSAAPATTSQDILLEALKAHLPAPLLDAVGNKLKQLDFAEMKIQVLEERLRKRRIEKYGSKSDKLPSAQLELLELEPGVSSAEVEAEAEREPLEQIQQQNRKKRRPHPGRQKLPADLPRVERIVACTAEQCFCQSCGKETTVIGYDESEMLDVEPAKYFVQATRREKRACKHCEAGGVAMAPVPPRIIEKSLVSDRIIIDTILDKYTAHLPLYRQSALLERDCGIDISRSTMDGWVMRVGELLMPVVAAMRRELLGGSYIQADETPVAVQMHDGRGNNHQAYLWQYGVPGGSVVFDFRMGRAREGPRSFLDKFDKLLQTDGYAAYDGVGGRNLVHAACWSHARRKFVDAVKLNPKDAVAAGLVGRIDALFAVDAKAREQKLDHAQRHQLRRQESAPLLDPLREALKAARNSSLPASTTAKACNYTLALWTKLTRFLDHPELELSNNLAENSMRPIALGRRNWIHFGHKEAGPKVAAILSVIESCRRLGSNPRLYLAGILPGLASKSIQSLNQITPAQWASIQPR
jgi:transposase